MMSKPIRKRYDPLTGKDEYSVVRIRPSWGLLSIFIFAYSLPIRYWLRFLPWHPFQYWSQPGRVVLATLGLSILGMIVAGFGLRAAAAPGAHQGRGHGLSRIGLFLNGAVLGILILAVVVLAVYWRFFR